MTKNQRIEFIYNLAIIVTAPWHNAWLCWQKPRDRAKAIVLFDRAITRASHA